MTQNISFDRWERDRVIKLQPVPVVWAPEDYNSAFYECKTSVGEITGCEPWEGPATQEKIRQDQLYQTWGYDADFTEHWQVFDSGVPKKLSDIGHDLSIIKDFSVSLLKLKPGKAIPWHMDTYAFYKKYYNNVPDQCVRRVLIFLENWDRGQVVQFGQDVVTHWKAGDAVTWYPDVWHGGANFGIKEFTSLQFTGTLA